MLPKRPRRLTLDVHAVELRTLGDISDRGRLFLECLNCGRLSGLDHQALIARYGAELALYDLRMRARCRNCHHRLTRLLIKRDWIRGHRAWLPESPKLGRD